MQQIDGAVWWLLNYINDLFDMPCVEFNKMHKSKICPVKNNIII